MDHSTPQRRGTFFETVRSAGLAIPTQIKAPLIGKLFLFIIFSENVCVFFFETYKIMHNALHYGFSFSFCFSSMFSNFSINGELVE